LDKIKFLLGQIKELAQVKTNVVVISFKMAVSWWIIIFLYKLLKTVEIAKKNYLIVKS
jgi:hypothetical protein